MQVSLKTALMFMFVVTSCGAITQTSETEQVTQNEAEWLEVNQDNILYMQFDTGLVTFHLADFFAPNHVQRIKNLVNGGHYDGIHLYRVIENFVVQGGPDDSKQDTDPFVTLTIKHEKERDIDKNAIFYEYPSADLHAEQVGYINSFPVARAKAENKEWLIHCNGTINMARSADVDSGTSHFAIVFGGYQRYLDRNSTAFGRIIDGWDAFYKVNRIVAEDESDQAKLTKVIKAYLGSSLEKAKQSRILVENTNALAFHEKVKSRIAMENEWFVHKGSGHYNICLRQPSYKIVASQ